MKHRIFFFFALLATVAGVARSQLNWVSNNGPYHAFIDDYAVGLKNGQVILYAADSSETSLMKSTDRGETWTHVLSLTGAFVNCVATFKSNADIVYAGSRTGQASTQGIWKSTNGGTTWTLLSNQPSNKSVSRIAIHPTNSNIVWAGCRRVPVSDPPVVHRSTDGGQSWLPFTLSNNRLNVSDIAVAENTGNIWVSTYNNGSLGNEGVWRTTNGGTGWTQENTGMDANNLSLASLAVDPNNPDVLYAGNRFLRSTLPRKMYKTVNATTQCTWSQVYSTSAEISISDIRVSPHSSNTVYVATGFDENGVGVLKSDNGGSSWTAYVSGIFMKKLRAIEIDPLSSSLVYSGGTGAHYKSFDGGATWQEKNTGLLLPIGTSLTKSGQDVLSIGNGFFFRSQNDGSTWQIMFDELFMLANKKKVAFDPNNSVNALAAFGNADGVVHIWRTNDKGVTWSLVFTYPNLPGVTNNHAVVAYEGPSTSVAYTVGFYLDTQSNGFVLKSTNAGVSWQQVFLQAGLKFNAVTVKGNIVYVAGSNGTNATVFKSTNSGANWAEVRNGLPNSADVISLAIDPTDDKIVYAGTTQGMYKTSGGGDNWTAANNGISYTNMASILVHPLNRLVIYAASNDGNTPHFYRSSNGGQTWTEISTGLPLAKVTDLTIDPTNPNTIFTATDAGIYHIAHRWTGSLAASTMWKTGEEYLVEGTLTIPSGVTLTVKQGATVKFFQNAALKVDGQLASVGTAGSPITFTSLNAGQTWKGITFGTTTGSQVQYANISNAQTAISARHDNGLSVAHCTIAGGTIGVYLYEAGGGGKNPPTSITDNTIIGTSSQGIFADVGASMAVIQRNTLQGPGNFGMCFVVSSPVQVVGNKASGFGKAGIYCLKASPSLVSGLAGGQNCSYANELGVWTQYYSNPILGRVVSSQSGLNSFAGNVSFQVVLEDHCIVFGEDNFFRLGGPDLRLDFSVDATSTLLYDPFLEIDPNGCTGGSAPLAINRSGKEIEEESSNGPVDDPRARQALRMRMERRHNEAMGLLRSIIASPQSSEELVRWAVNELLANYQAVSAPAPNDRLSHYLRALLRSRSNNQTKRIVRDVMAPACLHEGDAAGTLAALDESIRLHGNTPSEVLALYSKVSFALNVVKDIQLAENTLQVLITRYPTHELTQLATVLVQLNRNEQRMAPTSSAKFVANTNSFSDRPKVYSLDQNYPNPFNPTTQFNFALPEPSQVSLVVYDVLGRKVVELGNGLREAGYHSVIWNASNTASGVYFARFTATDAQGNVKISKVNKLLLTK